MRRAIISTLVVIGVVIALVGVELLSGSGSRKLRAAPALPTSVLVPPRLTLARLRGKPAVIHFWASWCGPCRKEAPEIERFARSLHGRANLVGIDYSDGLDGARSFIRQYGWTFPMLRDPNGVIGDRFRLNGLPTTYILDPRGLITETLIGPQTASGLQQALQRGGFLMGR